MSVLFLSPTTRVDPVVSVGNFFSSCPIRHHSYGSCECVPMWRVSMFMSVHGSMHVPLWISEGDVGCLESPRDLPVSGSTVLG